MTPYMHEENNTFIGNQFAFTRGVICKSGKVFYTRNDKLSFQRIVIMC